MCKWIPIKHSNSCGTDVIVSELPRDGEVVFVTFDRTKVCCDIFQLLPDGREDFLYLGIENVEAWMSLPKPYKPGDRSSLWVPIGHDPLLCLMLPDDGEQVLITVAGSYYVQVDIFRMRTDGTVGFDRVPIDNVTAWMKFPTQYKPTPDKCFKCNHGHLQHDEDSDNWFECELLQRDVPPCGKPNDCPLTEVD